MAAAENLETAREMERLRTLHSYHVLDTPSEDVFNECARLAASIGGTPTALVSLVDGNRQWFKAKVGLDADETPRDIAFCAHAINGIDVFVVPDATLDERFCANPLVTSEPKIRFYAGAPLITATGQALGTVCVIDYVPREMSFEQQQSLKILSRHVMAQLDLRRQLHEFTHVTRQRALELSALRQALDLNQFVLHYQPKVNLRTRRIVGVEALIRWQHPDRGLMPPANFIPLLEESEFIIEVGAWAIRQAAADHQSWRRLGLPAPRVAVNVSPVQLHDPYFVGDLLESLGAGSVSDAGIDIEITESVLIADVESSIDKLRAINELGVGIAIDDFGTGYSSLRYLAQLPITSLKIDRSFVTAMVTSPRERAIVSSIIALAHGLEISVVGEGVETEAQRQLLCLMRCDEAQGYLHSRPMPKASLEAMLRLEATNARE
jgi:EAL domain-containing protein (putative c-di-GMP-specific phosphodiesterase class I)